MNALLKTTAVAAILILGGCATASHQTPQEQAFETAKNSCVQETNAMIGHGRWDGDLQWDNQFEWCMQNKGYSKDQLKKIWY